MFNIKFKGNYTDESQLIGDETLPPGAIQFKEGDTIINAIIKGSLIASPLLLSMIFVIFLKIKTLTNGFEVDLSFGISFILLLVFSHLLTYLHELIHALLYPRNAEKEIWKAPSQGAFFVYCRSIVSKKRFIILCAAPAIILGIIPFIIWLLIYQTLPLNISIFFAILTWLMTFISVGDFYNVFNAVTQVPNKAKIFNYGLHSYWIKK